MLMSSQSGVSAQQSDAAKAFWICTTLVPIALRLVCSTQKAVAARPVGWTAGDRHMRCSALLPSLSRRRLRRAA